MIVCETEYLSLTRFTKITTNNPTINTRSGVYASDVNMLDLLSKCLQHIWMRSMESDETPAALQFFSVQIMPIRQFAMA